MRDPLAWVDVDGHPTGCACVPWCIHCLADMDAPDGRANVVTFVSARGSINHECLRCGGHWGHAPYPLRPTATSEPLEAA